MAKLYTEKQGFKNGVRIRRLDVVYVLKAENARINEFYP